MSSNRGRATTASSDGACSGNPGPGGWGALIRFEDGSVEEFGGFSPATTNNRMELQAVLEILKYLKNLPRQPHLTIKTDSKYLINGLNSWIKSWKRNGWRTAAGKPVLNKDLWQSLDNARLKNVEFEFVKGHSGDQDNERVDQIAVSYSKGAHIELESTANSNWNNAKEKTTGNTEDKLNEHGSPKLQRLLLRLDMVNHLAKQGYGLSIAELSDLLGMSTAELEKKKSSWQWRDWIIKPAGNSHWKLALYKESPSNTQEEEND